MRYAAFISYNHRDRRAAQWLHRALETYRIPSRLRGRDTAIGLLGSRLPPIFQDREELAASADLATSVRDALAEAEALIVVCSPHAVASKWVNEEIRAFTAMGRRGRVQCLIVEGEPNASRLSGADPARECLPPALFEEGGSEPLAADIRPGQDGRAAARLKLLAGVIGIGYDELRNREQQRRQKRLAAIAISSAIGFVVMAGLAISAWLARGEAVRQRDIAREKTATAERTVDFVKSLFEVSDPSEAKGAKVTAKEVLDRGAQRIAYSLRDEPNVKAELMTTLSQVYQGLGVFHAGDEIVRRSLQLHVSDGAVRARQYATLASADYRRGDYDQAVSRYKIALTNARGSADPNPALEASLLAAMGDAEARAGRTRAGEQTILAALRLDLMQFGSRHLTTARDLEALGYSKLAADDLPAARRLFERALAIRVPQQGYAHPQVSEDLSELGSIAFLQRDSVAAESFFRRAMRADEIVLGPDHPDVAITANNLARVMLERRAFRQAEPILLRAVAITKAQRDPGNDYFAFLDDNLGLVERELGSLARAEALFREGLAVAVKHKHRNRAPIMADLADLLCRTGRFGEGLAMLAAAAPIMRQDYPGDPWRSAWVVNTRGYCLVQHGQGNKGRSALLASMPAIKGRWPPGSLYNHLAQDRLRLRSRFPGH